MTCNCDMEPIAPREMIKLVFKEDRFYVKKGDVVYADRADWKFKDNSYVSYWVSPEDFGNSYSECRTHKDYLEQETPDPLFQLVFAQYYHGSDTLHEVKFPPMGWINVYLAGHQFARAMNIPEIRRNFWRLDTPEVMYTIRFDKVEV